MVSRAQKAAQANATVDLPAGTMQAKATTACLECHEARIILQQRLSKAAWTKEVDKMIKWGALVDPDDRDALIDYLSANFSPDKPALRAAANLKLARAASDYEVDSPRKKKSKAPPTQCPNSRTLRQRCRY